jgi:hypothetical protein
MANGPDGIGGNKTFEESKKVFFKDKEDKREFKNDLRRKYDHLNPENIMKRLGAVDNWRDLYGLLSESEGVFVTLGRNNRTTQGFVSFERAVDAIALYATGKTDISSIPEAAAIRLNIAEIARKSRFPYHQDNDNSYYTDDELKDALSSVQSFPDLYRVLCARSAIKKDEKSYDTVETLLAVVSAKTNNGPIKVITRIGDLRSTVQRLIDQKQDYTTLEQGIIRRFNTASSIGDLIALYESTCGYQGPGRVFSKEEIIHDLQPLKQNASAHQLDRLLTISFIPGLTEKVRDLMQADLVVNIYGANFRQEDVRAVNQDIDKLMRDLEGDLRSIYRTLSLKYHPDSNKGINDRGERMRYLNAWHEHMSA